MIRAVSWSMHGGWRPLLTWATSTSKSRPARALRRRYCRLPPLSLAAACRSLPLASARQSPARRRQSLECSTHQRCASSLSRAGRSRTGRVDLPLVVSLSPSPPGARQHRPALLVFGPADAERGSNISHNVVTATVERDCTGRRTR